MLTTSYPRFKGDYAGVFILDLATRLVQQGATVEVVAPAEAGLPADERISGIRVRRFSYMFTVRWQRVAYLGGIPSNLRNYWSAWLQLPLFFLSYIWTAFWVARRCDVIHAHWISSGAVAALLSRILSKPVVITLHGSDVNLLYGNRLLGALRSKVADRADCLIAVSSPLANRIGALGINAGKIRVIPNGVELSRLGDAKIGRGCANQLTWVGRMSAEKGLEFLIGAMPVILKAHPTAELTLVGDGPLRPVVEQLCCEHGVADRVRLTGMVSHEDVPRYLMRSTVFVLSSLNEGLPLALLEALGAGKPVVATRVGGVPDVVQEQGELRCGLLVPPADSEALASAIVELLNDPHRSRSMGLNGRKIVEATYTWQRAARETFELYSGLLGRPKPEM
jgi:glycosyltransferase involved in cell wall biosynthesis